MSQLVPCPACSRHVRVTEPTCPFCGDGLALAGTPAPALPKSRLGRAATFAFGATLAGVTAVVSCGGDDTTGGGADASTGTAGDMTGGGGSSTGAAGSSAGNAAGAAGSSTAGSNGSGGTVQDSGGVMALYGAPAAGGPPI